MNSIELTITKEDLETSIFTSTTDCPIARALKRAGMKDVVCGGWDVDFETHKNVDIRELTEKVGNMMNIFGKSINKPETFTYILKY